jgi:HK97 family phage prohead protease
MTKKTRTIPLSERLERKFQIEQITDMEARTVDAVLSTDTPLSRWGVSEVLSHDERSIDLSRTERGLPLLWGHDPDKPIGKVKNLRLDDGKLRGTLHFSNNPDAAWIWQDVRDGFLDDVSIGYSVSKWDVNDDETEYVARRWELLEASVVTVPADKAAGMNRSFTAEEKLMSDETTLNPGADSGDGAKVVEVSKASFNRGKAQGKKEALTDLQSRVRAINELFDQYTALFPANEELRGLHMDLITNGASIDQARQALLTALPSYYAEPTGTGFKQSETVRQTEGRSEFRSQASAPTGGARISSVRDESDSFGKNLEQALLVRCGLVSDKEEVRKAREAGLAGLTFVELGRRSLEMSGRGMRFGSLDKHGIAKEMLTRAGPMTSSDFPYVLANVATKIAKKGYTEANTTYQEWCNIAYLPDFKAATIPGLGAFSDLNSIPTGGAPYLYGTIGEAYETATLATYGALFGLNRHAIVNDDMNAFARTGLAMGAAAARKVNQLAYAILNSGQTMTEDSTTLFDASTHANYVASGTAPSVTTLNAAEAAMAKQKAPRVSTDTTNAYLNITPGHLIVPVALMGSARVLIASTYDPAGTAGTLVPNPWMGRVSVSADPLLDGTSTTAWFMAAPKGNSTIDTITMFFLEGSNGEPMVEEQNQFESDGITYKVRIDAVARALDWRGMYKNSGTGG